MHCNIFSNFCFRGCGTCFAFGQTGAGKTFTLLGDKVTPGLYQLAAKDIFHSMSTRQWGNEVHLWLSYYEIYCGQLYDLLNKRKRLKHVTLVINVTIKQ